MIFCVLSAVLILLSILSVTWLIVSIVLDKEDQTIASFIIVAIIGVLGWLLIGQSVCIKTEVTTLEAHVLYDAAAIYVVNSGVVYLTSTDVTAYNRLKESPTTILKRVSNRNMYNGEISAEYKLP
jgi:hypothetical protein